MGWHAAITLCSGFYCFLVGGIGADAWKGGIAVLVLEAGGMRDESRGMLRSGI